MSEEIPYDVVEDFYEIIESPVVTEELDNTDVDSSIQVLDFTGGLGSLVKSSSNSEEAIDVEDEEIVSEDSNEVIEVEEVEDLDSTVKELQEQVAERFWENNAIYENMAQVQNEALLMVDDIEAAHTLASEATVAAQDAHNEAVVASGAASAAQTAADQAALDALAAAGLAIAAQGSVDNLQIGGRNLLPLSGRWGELPAPWWKSNGGGMTLDTAVLYNGFPTLRTQVGNGIRGEWVELEFGVDYTFSALIKSDTAFTGTNVTPLHNWVSPDGVSNTGGAVLLSRDQDYPASAVGTWKRLHFTFRMPIGTRFFKPFLYRGNNDGVFVNVAYLKLEKGNKATDWTPAPEDVEAGIASKADVLIQSAEPTEAMRKDTTLWIDTTGGANTPKRWNGAAWIAVTDKAATDAANAAAAAQTAANNAIAQAQAAQDEAEDALAAAASANILAAGKITTFYQSTTPTATATGDLWLNTSVTPNQFRRWDGSAWVDMTDAVLQKALTAAGDAKAIADGKVRTFAQSDAPTGMVAGDAGDLWIDTNDGNKMYRWSGTAWVAVQDTSIAAAQSAADAAAADAAAAAGVANNVATRGSDLVTNGNGQLGNNTNFTNFTYKPDAPTGAVGSFTKNNFATVMSDEFMLIDYAKTYVHTASVRQTTPGVASKVYVGLAPYDAQKQPIGSPNYVYHPDTMTTLATPLNPGDTTVQLTSVPSGDAWTKPASNFIGFWDWVDPSGKKWPAGTYTRRYFPFTSISGTTVTLSSTYTGGVLPAGTPVSRNFAGNSFMYTAVNNIFAPEEWTKYTSQPITGIFDGAVGGVGGATYAFPQGTAYVRLVFLTNRNAAGSGLEPGSVQAFAGLSFSDASGALAAANSKADVLIQSTAPAVEMQKSSTLWIDTTGGANTPKRWSGSAWVVITDKAAVDAANAAANAAAAAATAQAAADAAQATANAAQTAAGNAQTTATNALTSANGRNSRTISTSAPSGVNNVSTGNPNVEGDTWWRWDNTTSRNVIGQWVWRSGSWVAEMIGHQTISSMDVNKLVVTGSAKMSQVVVEKIVGDSAYFGLLTADKFQSIPLSIYFDGTLLGADLTALRAANSGYTAGAGTLTGNSTIWLTHTAVGSAANSNLTKGIKYRIRVTATGLTSAYSMAIDQTTGYTLIGETTIGDGYIECYVTPSSDDARVCLYAEAGAPTITISRIEIMPMTGATIIEPGSIDTIHLKAKSITADKILVGAGNNTLVGGPVANWNYAFASGASRNSVITGNAALPDRVEVSLGTSAAGTSNRVFFGLSGSMGATYGAATYLVPVVPGLAYTARTTIRSVGVHTTRPTVGVGIYWYSNLDFVNSLSANFSNYFTSTVDLTEASVTAVAPAGAMWAMMSIRSNAPDAPGENRLIQFTAPYFGQAVDGSLIVDGAIDGKTINGANIYSPNSTALPRVHVGGSQVRVIRSDGEGGETVTTQLGGSTRDQIALYDTSGDLISGLMSNGSATIGGELSTESLLVGGDNVIDLIDARPKGVISIMKATADSDKAGTGQLGYVMLRGDTSTNRVYRVSVRGMMAVMTAGDTAQVIIQTFEPSSKVLQIGNYTIPKTTAEHISLETTFRGLVDGSARFGILFRNATANRGVFWSGRTNYPVEVVLEDLGSVFYNSNGATATFDRMGGTPLTAGSNTDETGTTTYTKTYSSSWTRSWRGSGTVSDYLHHGYYGGYQRYSMVGFPAAVTTDLSGATIKKVEIYLANQSWWGSSGTAYIGKSTATSAPANPQTSGGSAFTVTNWAQGAKKWVTAPSGWWASNTRAITLGEGAGTGTTAYGKFATAGVKLRITYEK